MKYSKVIGIAACVLLIVACFLPWTYHADINKTFTGFFSEQNMYGKPGKFLVFFAVVSILLILLSKIWAKRVHLFLSALSVGYAIKTYILFTSCYNAYCPDKKAGVYLMLLSSIIILVVSIFPDMKSNFENSKVPQRH
ncbi:MAG: hypothetical protein H0W12_07115 [Chitinophagaceae bacterium]|nr:hypothetical protein [Chitinophagaceae bacterium]